MNRHEGQLNRHAGDDSRTVSRTPPAEHTPLDNSEEDQLVHLSGVGLWFVKWTIGYSRGTLSFEENEYGGTTVSMRIPKAPEMLLESGPFGSE
jgi:hypothetical protein